MDYLDLEKNTSAFDYFWYKAKRKLIDIIFLKYNIKKMLILEVGCGAGSQLEALSVYGNKVFGSDINIKALTEAEKRGFTVFYQDIEKEIKNEGKYDVVCAFDVLEHIKSDESALKNIYRSLKPGGLFVFMVPAFQILFSSHDVHLKHYRRYSMKELEQKLLNNNFKPLDLYYWNSILFPIISLKRLLYKSGKPKSDVGSLPKLLNSFLYSILIIENQLIKINIKLPLGLSIVGIARRL